MRGAEILAHFVTSAGLAFTLDGRRDLEVGLVFALLRYRGF